MGFGIRVPGIRISTRGVRIGPRFANVRVSARGVGVSAGPRIARIHVSNRGIGASFGLGPVRIGSHGVSVGGGLGPLFGSIGTRGISAGLGVGPIFGYARTGKKGSRRNSNASYAIPQKSIRATSPKLNELFEDYVVSVTNQNGAERNKDQMRWAGIQAAMLSISPLLAANQNHDPITLQLPDSLQLDQRAEEIAEREIRSEGVAVRDKAKKTEAVPEHYRIDAIRILRKREIFKPEHPASQYGWPIEEVPPFDFLKKYARKKLGKDKQTLEDFALQVAHQHKEWLEASSHYESLINDEIEDLVRENELLSEEHEAEKKRLEDAIVQRTLEIQGEQKKLLDVIRATFKLFEEGDVVVTTIVLQASFSDNGGTAAPVGIDGTDLLVLMSVPEPREVVWPERVELENFTSAAKKTEDEINAEFGTYVLAHAIATARETFAIADKIQRVRVIVLDEEIQGAAVMDRRALLKLTMNRNSDGDFALDDALATKVKQLTAFLSKWSEQVSKKSEEYTYELIKEWERKEHKTFSDSIAGLTQKLENNSSEFERWTGIPKSTRPLFIDLVDPNASGESDIEFSQNIEVDDFGVMDLHAEERTSIYFWIMVSLLVEVWDSEEIDENEIRTRAIELSLLLSNDFEG